MKLDFASLRSDPIVKGCIIVGFVGDEGEKYERVFEARDGSNMLFLNYGSSAPQILNSTL